MANNDPFLSVEDYAELVGFLLGAVAFITLIGLDLRKAIKKGAYWVPGRAVVLSALTIQIMNFIQNQSVLLDKFLAGSGSLSNEDLKDNLFMIHISRVMLCVLVAFFLPGMARPGYQEKWTKIGAIGLTVFIDIFSEVTTVHNRTVGSRVVSHSFHSFYSWTQGRQVSEISFFVSGAIISITLIWLILLLLCAAIACKSIRNITSQKIPIILAEPAESSWKGVEDQVLKSWIVARACCPESIIARSVLASSAALGVTICILCSVVGWIFLGPKVNFQPKPVFCLKFITTILQMIFILIGWAIIGWRWLSSVALYGRGRKKKDFFQVEDYWTRNIADLQEAENLKLRQLKVDERISKMFVTKLRKLKVDERVSKMIAREKKRKTSLVSIWLRCVFWLQWYVVFFSKLCWFLSVCVFGNTVICKVVKWIFSSHFQKADKDYNDYKEILNIMDNFFDQTTHDVILTNRKSIKQARGIMTKGNNDGENCHAMVPFLRDWGSGTCVDMQYLDPEEALSKTGLKFLWRHHPDTPPKVQKYLKYGRKRSLKLTAVSLINVIVCLSPLSERDSLQAYYEAWELIDLVDEANPKTDGLLSKAADRLFTEIRYPTENQQKRSTTMCETAAKATINDLEAAKKAISDLARDRENEADNICTRIEDGEDTMEDWEKLAAYNALSKLCLSIDYTEGNLKDLKHELKRSLGNIISYCVKNVGPALVDNCRKWAQGLEKTKLLEAVYIAGKSKGLSEKLEWSSDVQIVTEAAQQGGSENMGNGPATEDSDMV